MMGQFAEWIARLGPGLANHLWQTTAFVAAAWLVTLALRQNQARVRYAVWLAASLKFLVPFALLMAAGNLLPHPRQAVAPVVYTAMDVVEEPFAEPPVMAAPAVHVMTMREPVEAMLPVGLFALWAMGVGVVVLRWARGWSVARRTMCCAEIAREGREWEILRRVEAHVPGAENPIDFVPGMPGLKSRPISEAKTNATAEAEANARIPRLRRFTAALGMTALHGAEARPHPSRAWMGHPIELRMSAERMEPGVFGVWRPVLVWPRELSARLEDEHIEAIVAHEMAHVRRRDNLTAALHMVVETVFWFHPAVWWMERQMVKEREQACDEAVVYPARFQGRGSGFEEGARSEGCDAIAPKQSLDGAPARGDSSLPLIPQSGMNGTPGDPSSPLIPQSGVNGAPDRLDVRTEYAEVYAEALLKTCRFCIESPLVCVAGVTGADLRQRVVEIVTGRALLKMSWAKKALISAAAVCVVAAPVVLGQAKAAQRLMLAAIEAAPKPMQAVAKAVMAEVDTAGAAQAPAAVASDEASSESQLRFDVVSIRPAAPELGTGSRRVPLLFNDDGVSTRDITLGHLLEMAYEMDLTPDRIIGAPGWATSQSWDIEAKVADSDVAAFTKIAHDSKPAAKHERSLMLQDLLAQRFGIKVHHETREGTGYALVVAKGGLKATLAAPRDPNAQSFVGFKFGNGHLEVPSVEMGMFARLLAIRTNTTIVDKTGLTGLYDLTLDWQPDDASGEPTGKPFLTTALEEQLGLKLVPNKVPVDVVVIDHAQKPSVDGAEVTPDTDASSEAQLSAGYRKWLDEDVHWLITPQERADFLKLATDKDRAAFIDAFWERRNAPGAAKGAYKQEVFTRIAYANGSFAVTGRPGWATDRGRAMILYGKPDTIEAHPSVNNSGYQVWLYRDLPGLGSVSLRFVRKGGGDYQLDGAWPQVAAAQVQEKSASGQAAQNSATDCPNIGGLFTAYDVVSVRPTNAIPRSVGLQEQPDGIHSETVTVAMMAQQAYGADPMLPTDDAVSGLPDWGKGEYFAVNGKMNPEQVAAFAKLDKDQQKSCRIQMLRALLAERFKLQVHSQSRQVLGYELVVASGGPKMKEVTASDPDVFVGASGKPMLKNLVRIEPANGGQEVIVQNFALDQLANILAGQGGVDHKVVNKTGLSGLYKYTLTYALQQRAGPEPTASDPVPTVFNAVEDQLGLKLQRGSETVGIVVVDHLERPTAN